MLFFGRLQEIIYQAVCVEANAKKKIHEDVSKLFIMICSQVPEDTAFYRYTDWINQGQVWQKMSEWKDVSSV